MISKVQQSPTFQAVKISGNNMPESVKIAISSSRAFQKFGKFYDADVSYIKVASSKNPKVQHPALMINEVKPVGILGKLLDKFRTGKNKQQFVYITTRGQEDADLGRKLETVSSKYLINKYRKATKS